MNRSEKFSI